VVEPVDAVFSRFGVMFFAEPTAAFTHLRSVARAGGRLAFCAWQDPFANPWMIAPVMAAVPVIGPPQLPEPGAPGPFSLASPDAVRALLTRAGWSSVQVEGLALERPFPAGDARATARMMCRTNPMLAAGLREHPERRDELLAAVADGLGEYVDGDAVVFAAAAWIVSAGA
jgi:hypothetical protein